MWDAVQAAVLAPWPWERRLQAACDILRDNVPHYDWVGFYLADPEAAEMLMLGPFAGAPTEHVRIPFGRGVCGRAAATRATVVVDDVAAEGNYLSCNPEVRSEVVVPIVLGERVWGELDIDSHEAAAFTEDDVSFLTRLATLIADTLADV